MKCPFRDPLVWSLGGEVSTQRGEIDWYDPVKGYGYILTEDGERALLHVTCLRAAGYLIARKGAVIEFEALRRPD
jgi:CspA family cold shock protein